MLLLTFALVAAACGDDDAASTTTAAPATTVAATTTQAPATTQAPTTTEASAFPVNVRGAEIPAEPMRIVSGSATHTEILFEIGAGDRVVATDTFSNFPAAANDTEKFDAFNLNVEAVAAFDPDLVIISFDPGDVVAGLEALGIPTVLFAPPGPANLDEVYAEWLDVGTATGQVEAAEALIAEVAAEVEGLLAGVPALDTPISYFYELDPTLFSAGPGSLIDTLMGTLGLQSIVPADAGPFPQLTAEALIAADPQFVFLADTAFGESAETFSARPGFDVLSAVVSNAVVELDSDVASRWGPRIVELIRVVAKEVHG